MSRHPRHPYERYQVRYQDGKRQRSAGIFPTKRRAEAERRAIDRGRTELVAPAEVDLEWARTLFGEYVATQVVAGLEGPAPNLRVRHPHEARKAHPARLRRHPAR